MRRLDRGRRIDFIDVGTADTVCRFDRSLLLARFPSRENGQIVSGASAFAAMWRAIPLLLPFGLAARNRDVLRLLERLYLRFLRVRPVLQRWVR